MKSMRSILLLLLLWLLLLLLVVVGDVNAARSSRIVRVRQGKLQGIVLVPNSARLGPVESYLGIPYAGAPIGRLRFMPPSAPQSWPPNVVRKVDEFGPVCPQVVPDLSKEKEALRYVTVGRLNYLKRLFQYLQKNQSEDCLYLNIYTPEKLAVSTYPRKLPVIVFVHGESYEWNSGNPYDGSVLASYGQVVVVTLNYRLGFLGFLKTEDRGMGNFGLLDILAALHWIQENIAQFGGDSSSVTLMGQGTGAALTSLLLLSPVSQRAPLFKRAILMSGSSLAKSAIVRDPRDITRQVADETKCPLQMGLLAECLREKDVRTILNLQIKTPPYSTPIGPYVDGFIIPKLPSELIQDYVPSYDLMFGMTVSESFHLFPAYSVTHGVSQAEKGDILRAMVRTEFETFGQNLEQVIQTVENEYRDIYQTREDKMVNLQVLLEIFSDARVVAPLLRSAELHSNNQKSCYLYLYNHTTTNGYFPPEFGSVNGEDLAYVLGMPLVGGTFHYVGNYTEEERVLSQHIMSFWVNFAKTGNPGSSSPRGSNTLFWPPFDATQKKYMILSTDSKPASHYKPQKMAVWDKIIPDQVDSLRGATNTENPTSTLDPNTQVGLVDGPSQTGEQHQQQQIDITDKIPTNQIQKKDGGMFSEQNLPISLIVIIGLVLLLLNLSACSGVYYQRQKVKRREETLERKIKRLSDAGFRHEELSENGSAVHCSKEDFTSFTFPKSETSSLKRAHFQQRSNSVKEVPCDSGGIVLKSALKKPNQSSETLSQGSRVVYTQQSFNEAAYPSLPRASKSIPNISFNDSLDSDGRIFKDRPLSRSSNTLDSEASRPYQELRPRSTGRGGPDVLVYYDTRPEDDNQAESTPACKSKTASLSKKLPGFLKLRKEEKVAPPIIEMVPVSTPPSTYQFPSRPSSNCVDPIYVQRPHFHRHPVPLGSSQYGITYPNYTPLGGGVYPSLPSPTYLAMGGAPGVFTSPRTPVLTTPRHPLSHYGSLQRAKVPLQDTGHSSTLPRQPGDGCIYGYMVPANRISGPPPISRTHSMDQSGKRTNSVDQSVNRISFDQSGPRGPQLEQSGHVIYSSRPTTGQPEKRVSTVGYIRVPDHRTSIIVENLSRLTNPVASRPDTVISTRDFCLEHPVNRFSQSQPEPPCTELQPVLKSEISKVADGSDPTKREPIKLESICDGSLQAPSSTIQSAPNTPVSTVQSIAKPSPTGGGPGALSDGGPTAVRSEHTMGNGVPAASRGLTTTAAGGVTTTVGVMTATAGGVATPTGGLATSAAGHTTTAAGLTTTAGGVVSPTGGVITIAGGVGGRVVPTSVGVVVSLPLSSPKTPVLRKLGEKTPPGTLKGDRPNSSCKSWYTQYSQAFLSKTIDTPVEDLPPLGDEEFMEEDDDEDDSTSSEPSKESQKQRASIAKQPL